MEVYLNREIKECRRLRAALENAETVLNIPAEELQRFFYAAEAGSYGNACLDPTEYGARRTEALFCKNDFYQFCGDEENGDIRDGATEFYPFFSESFFYGAHTDVSGDVYCLYSGSSGTEEAYEEGESFYPAISSVVSLYGGERFCTAARAFMPDDFSIPEYNAERSCTGAYPDVSGESVYVSERIPTFFRIRDVINRHCRSFFNEKAEGSGSSVFAPGCGSYGYCTEVSGEKDDVVPDPLDVTGIKHFVPKSADFGLKAHSAGISHIGLSNIAFSWDNVTDIGRSRFLCSDFISFRYSAADHGFKNHSGFLYPESIIGEYPFIEGFQTEIEAKMNRHGFSAGGDLLKDVRGDSFVPSAALAVFLNGSPAYNVQADSITGVAAGTTRSFVYSDAKKSCGLSEDIFFGNNGETHNHFFIGGFSYAGGSGLYESLGLLRLYGYNEEAPIFTMPRYCCRVHNEKAAALINSTECAGFVTEASNGINATALNRSAGMIFSEEAAANYKASEKARDEQERIYANCSAGFDGGYMQTDAGDLRELRSAVSTGVSGKFTQAEIKVDMSGMRNNFNEGGNFDDFVSELTEAISEAVSIISEGVHS